MTAPDEDHAVRYTDWTPDDGPPPPAPQPEPEPPEHEPGTCHVCDERRTAYLKWIDEPGDDQPERAWCTDCRRPLTPSHEEQTSGLCLRCLNGPTA